MASAGYRDPDSEGTCAAQRVKGVCLRQPDTMSTLSLDLIFGSHIDHVKNDFEPAMPQVRCRSH
jgi:hypothetical protein